MTGPTVIDRYLCLSVDVLAYGTNNDVRQAQVQHDLATILDIAGRRAGVNRDRWLRQAKGDEELALVPSTEPYQLIVCEYCRELDRALNWHNAERDRSERLRLRLAMDEGPVSPADLGYAGGAVVAASRLGGSSPIREALRLTEVANLAVIVSNVVYRDWVRSGHSTAQPEWFREVDVREKELTTSAWLWLPGADVHAIPLTGPPLPPADSGAHPSAPQVVFLGDVKGIQIGDRNTQRNVFPLTDAGEYR